MAQDHHGSTDALIGFEQDNRAAIITLNRPEALNALSTPMIAALERHYHQCAKQAQIYGVMLQAALGRAFCAGADVRQLRDWLVTGRDEEVIRFFREEYQHSWTLEQFIKPSVALIDGVVMGGGVGISIYGTHRVAGENIQFAMPETGIGLVPDIGASWFLPRMPGEIGTYLGLTGTALGQADAFYAGFATHCIPAAHFGDIRAAVAEGEPIDPVLDALHQPPGESTLDRLRPAIDRVFGAPTLEEIIARLEDEQAVEGLSAQWAEETAAILARRAPMSLKIALRQIREGARMMTLKEALQMEFRVVMRLLRRPDFVEGVRAMLVDKDCRPAWQPASLAEISDYEAAAFLAPLEGPGEEELALEDYWRLVE